MPLNEKCPDSLKLEWDKAVRKGLEKECLECVIEWVNDLTERVEKLEASNKKGEEVKEE